MSLTTVTVMLDERFMKLVDAQAMKQGLDRR